MEVIVKGADLPRLESLSIVAVPDEEADKLAQVLFDQGYTVVINFRDRIQCTFASQVTYLRSQ